MTSDLDRRAAFLRLSDQACVVHDAVVNALVDDIHAAMADRQAAVWVLIDPTLRDPLDELAEIDSTIRAERRLIDISERAVPSTRRPYLIPVDLARNASCRLLEAAIRMAIVDGDPTSLFRREGHRISGVLASTAESADLTRHLGRMAIIRLPKGPRSLFRYFDPVVLDLLWPSLDEVQQRALLGPVQQWHLMSRQGRWMNLSVSPAAESVDNGYGAFALTPQQSDALAFATFVNQAAAMASAANGERLDPSTIRGALETSAWAARQGLTSAGDQVAMLTLLFTLGHSLVRHPLMAPVWRRVKDGLSWDDAIADLTREDWIAVSTS